MGVTPRSWLVACAALAAASGCDATRRTLGMPPPERGQSWQLRRDGAFLGVWASCSDDACPRVLVIYVPAGAPYPPSPAIGTSPGWVEPPIPDAGYWVAQSLWWKGRELDPGVYLHRPEGSSEPTGPCRASDPVLTPRDFGADEARWARLMEVLAPCLP